MNQKKAKSIRRTMKRLFGRDPREVVLVAGKANSRLDHVGTNKDGTPKLRHFVYTGTDKLAPGCGRAEYQKMKRDEMRPRDRGGRTLGPSHLYFPSALDAQRAAA